MGNESRRQEPENKKQKLAFGLNDRQQRAQGQQRRPIDSHASAQSKNVLMDGSDDDNGDDSEHEDDDRGKSSSQSYRSRVNRDLRREQEALRMRASQIGAQPPAAGAASTAAVAAAAVGAASTDLYDYDGSYDTFKAPQQQQPAASSSASASHNDARKSRYVGELLKAAEIRQRERELRMERKVAKEQAEEAKEDESLGNKDRFVTSAYKRTLQERELWVRDQQAKEVLEQQADVTHKNNASIAMSSFYSNLSRNVAMGGGGGDGDDGGGEGGHSDSEQHRRSDEHGDGTANDAPSGRRSGRTGLGDEDDAAYPSGTFLDGFEKPSDPTGDDSENINTTNRNPHANVDPSQAQWRQIRERKVEQARARYFERHPDRKRDAAAVSDTAAQGVS